MSSQASVPTQITKTAQDAINAKLSCLEASYDSVMKGPNRKLYKDLMHQIVGDKVKRQSPLVNAGYAIRMEIISSILSSFIELNSNSPTINVVILGAGLDPLGFWALAQSSSVQVFEVDCLEIYLMKSEILKNTNILTTDKCNETNGSNVMQGAFETTIGTLNTPFNYTLLSANLRNLTSLQQAMHLSKFQNKHPTIVISELVLAYLGKESVGNLMNYISNTMCVHQSMFIAYEPVYPDEAHVTNGYAQKYFDQFTCKLEKGRSTHTFDSNESAFEPMGSSPSSVLRMLRRQEFDHYVDCSPISSISRFLKTCSTSSKETFDEHAALRLHLSCYALIYATSSDVQGKDAVRICPWLNLSKASKGGGFRTKTFIHEGNERFLLSSLQSSNQKQVQSLFKSTYEHLFQVYPSVRKLVTSALKSDLSTRTSGFEERYSYSDCCIWNHYSHHDGAFFVVLDSKFQHECEKVVGCIGVKKCLAFKTIEDKQSTSTQAYYEIFRLAVDPEYQGQGIGKALLEAVETYILKREEGIHCDDAYQVSLFANSPQVLEAANKLYLSYGFHLHSETMIGIMNIRMFIKHIIV